MAERILLSPPDVSGRDREALLRAFDSGWVAPAGPEIDQFETDLAVVCDVRSAVALSSGTAALQLALRLLGVGPGDLVVCQTFTFVATANAALAAGATPVFIDSEDQSWNLSPELLEEELEYQASIGNRVGAVIAVDLYGRCADYQRLDDVCMRYDVPLVEDAAESLGSQQNGRAAGAFGRFGVLSFNGNKIITSSGGGALLCHDPDSAARARHLATQARDPAPHYEHTEAGYNFRLSNLLAALGRSQLQTLPERIRRRRAIRAAYDDALRGIGGVRVFGADNADDNAWLSCVLFDDTDPEHVRRVLDAADIEARPLWKPMHLQPLFAGARRRVDGTSEGLFARGLCLPSGSGMTDEDVDRIIDALIDAVT